MKLGSRNNTLPQEQKKELLKRRGVYGVKKIEIHEDYDENDVENDLAILTLARPITFDRETKKIELQTKSYRTKSKVQSKLVCIL
jgi:secreted trypsin-like serine protease